MIKTSSEEINEHTECRLQRNQSISGAVNISVDIPHLDTTTGDARQHVSPATILKIKFTWWKKSERGAWWARGLVSSVVFCFKPKKEVDDVEDMKGAELDVPQVLCPSSVNPSHCELQPSMTSR